MLILLAAIALQVQPPPIRDGYALPQDAKRAAHARPAAAAKPAVRAAVVPLEWEDLRHPEAIEHIHFDQMFFSRGTYFQQNRARQAVFGSVADFVGQCSYEAAPLTGRSHQWITAGESWAAAKGWTEDAAADRVIARAIRRAAERDGEALFADVSHAFFVYMGTRAELPERHPLRRRTTTVTYDGRPITVTILDSGLAGPDPQGVAALVGLSSVVQEYARALGAIEHDGFWCGVRRADTPLPAGYAPTDHRRPQLCAVCRMRLGWVKPATVDPAVRQRIALRPLERFSDALVLPVAADLSEYYVVENRQRVAMDRALPAPGILVWRVKGDACTLMEAHGLPQRDASWKLPWAVPFPTVETTGFTPSTQPPSGGGVSIAEIAFDDSGVAYVEVGAEASRDVEFEGERYLAVPAGPRASGEAVELAVVRVEFADVALTGDAKLLRSFLFDFDPRVVVSDARGEVGRLTSGLADYVYQASGGRAFVRGSVAERVVKIGRPRAEIARLPADRREKEFFAAVAEAVAGKPDAVMIVVAGPPAPPFLQAHGGKFSGGAYALVPEDAATRDVGTPASLVLRAAGLDGRSGTTAGDKVWCLAGQTNVARGAFSAGPSLPCAWCRERVGWLRPHEAKAGKFALGPTAAFNHAVKVPIREGECYVLENRARWEFDRALPREGLVVWHVTPPDARCTSCAEAGILDVWLVHDPPQGQAGRVGGYAPWLSLPKKGLSLRLGEGGPELTGVKTDARSTVYFEVLAPQR